jgi:hypothetical protein
MKDITRSAAAHTVKTTQDELVYQFWQVLEAHREAFKQDRTFVRVCVLTLGAIFAFARHTVTQSICAIGQAASDPSSWYRVFSKDRWNEERVMRLFTLQTLQHVPVTQPYVTAVDGTPIVRSSQTMPGTGWGLSAITAPFKKGLCRMQRFLHCAWLPPIEEGYTRAVPLRFLAAFTAKARPSAVPARKDWEAALDFMKWLRTLLDSAERQLQPLVVLADGAFDKVELWKGLPDRVTMIVRTAQNRVLREMPGLYGGRGRRRIYGDKVAQPREILHERDRWQTKHVSIRGRKIKLRYTIRGCFLRERAADCPVFLLVIKGETYRVGKRRPREVYRDPAYFLIRAMKNQDGAWDVPFSDEQILQWVWQRWEVEVTHRELKTSFGVGQMQCWNKRSAVTSVQWMVWVYAVMMLAGYRTWGWFGAPAIQTRWWRGARRWSFTTLWRQLRARLWRLDEFRAACHESASNGPKFDATWSAIVNIATFSTRG